MLIFGIAIVSHWHSHIFLSFTWLDIKMWFLPSRRIIYSIANKVTRSKFITIWFHVFLKHLRDIFKANNVKLFEVSSLEDIAPYPLTSISSALLLYITAGINALMLSNSTWGVFFSNNSTIELDEPYSDVGGAFK